MPKQRLNDLEKVQIESPSDLRNWLYANHTRTDSIWLVTFKKSDPERYVSYDAFVDEAMCFGWVDSVPRKLDEHRTMHLLSPRKPGSGWSAVNKDRINRMEAENKMHPMGRAAVAAAKADGSWDFLNDVDALIEPGDLVAALDAKPPARENFDLFSRSSRRGILEWIKQAKRPETRAKRVTETVELAAKGIKANH
jgi:uncharacterized protein YdeI (YjbR/CyaY-like superfamily)